MPTHGVLVEVVVMVDDGVVAGEVVAPRGGIASGVAGTAVATGSVLVSDVAGGGRLKPPGSSSAAPIGIPTRPTAATVPMPVGDDPEAAGFDDAVTLGVAHVPDTVPALASNRGVGLDVPGVEVVPLQTVVLPLMAFCGTMPAKAGLTPGDASCVAPSGTPAGATGAPGPMPSGVAIPSGGGVTCAKAGDAIASAIIAIKSERYFIEDSIADSVQSTEASAVAARGLPGDLAEGRREGARLAKAER
jgi:hypothetical protein